jgi:hypothetical protein
VVVSINSRLAPPLGLPPISSSSLIGRRCLSGMRRHDLNELRRGLALTKNAPGLRPGREGVPMTIFTETELIGKARGWSDSTTQLAAFTREFCTPDLLVHTATPRRRVLPRPQARIPARRGHARRVPRRADAAALEVADVLAFILELRGEIPD